MKMKILLCLLPSFWAVGVCLAGDVAVQSSSALTIDSVIVEVLKNNRSLKSTRAGWEALKERVPQEKAWADPKAGVDIERSGTTRFDTFTDNEWMISQEIPISGKNRLRGEVARAEADAFHGTIRQRELQLVTLARIAFYRYANGLALIDLNRKTEEILKQFTDSSRDKYRLGLRSQADVLMAETELAKNAEVLRDLEQRVSEEQSRLNVLMNRPASTTLGTPDLKVKPFPDVDVQKLQAMALRHRPDLESAQFKTKAARTRQALAKRQWIPDPELRVEARQFNGARKTISEYDTGIFFNIPWINHGKYKAAEREAQKARESAEEELAGLELETMAMVRDQLKKMETAHHHLGLFEEKIIPLARQTLQATLTAYGSEKATLLDLLTAERSVRESEAMFLQHQTDYLIALSEMETLVGPLHVN
jgi:cobalt-zinc-cadmium efflux system outer membrane protein